MAPKRLGPPLAGESEVALTRRIHLAAAEHTILLPVTRTHLAGQAAPTTAASEPPAISSRNRTDNAERVRSQDFNAIL